MRRNDQILLTTLLGVGLLIVFWLLVLSPKRHEAASLKDDVSQLQGQLAEAQQAVAAGEASRKTFGTNYRRLVVLGKAVPADSEQASLLVQLQRLADRSGVSFQTFDLSDSGSTAPTPTTPTPPSEPSTGGADSTTPVAAPAIPTEASAAMLPIGASVGPAGLAVMPYDLTFTGGFFEIADFMRRLDNMVHIRHGRASAGGGQLSAANWRTAGGDATAYHRTGKPGVHGRLVTIDGFTLTPQPAGTTASANPMAVATPTLAAALTVTTYLTPADQGVTAGASPTGPVPATPSPASTTTSTGTSTPTPGATSVTP